MEETLAEGFHSSGKWIRGVGRVGKEQMITHSSLNVWQQLGSLRMSPHCIFIGKDPTLPHLPALWPLFQLIIQ